MDRPAALNRSPRRIALVTILLVLAATAVVMTIAATRNPQRASGQPPSVVENQREASRLFVLLSSNVDQLGQVVTMDPSTGTLDSEFSTGTDPGFATSRDGTRVYIASGQDAEGILAVIDTESGETIKQVPLPARWLGTLPASFPWVALSPNERWLYVLAFESVRPEQDAYYIRVFDTRRNEFLEEELSLPCMATILLPGDSTFDAACGHQGLVASTPVGADGRFGRTASTQVADGGIAGAARLPGSSGVILLTKTGQVVRLDSDGVTDVFELDGADKSRLVNHGIAVSPDGKMVYIGLGGNSQGRITHIDSYEVSTGRPVASVDLPFAAWTMAIGADGQRVYAPGHGAKIVLVLNGATLEVLTELGVPGNPVMVDGP